MLQLFISFEIQENVSYLKNLYERIEEGSRDLFVLEKAAPTFPPTKEFNRV